MSGHGVILRPRTIAQAMQEALEAIDGMPNRTKLEREARVARYLEVMYPGRAPAPPAVTHTGPPA